MMGMTGAARPSEHPAERRADFVVGTKMPRAYSEAIRELLDPDLDAGTSLQRFERKRESIKIEPKCER